MKPLKTTMSSFRATMAYRNRGMSDKFGDIHGSAYASSVKWANSDCEGNLMAVSFIDGSVLVFRSSTRRLVYVDRQMPIEHALVLEPTTDSKGNAQWTREGAAAEAAKAHAGTMTGKLQEAMQAAFNEKRDRQAADAKLAEAIGRLNRSQAALQAACKIANDRSTTIQRLMEVVMTQVDGYKALETFVDELSKDANLSTMLGRFGFPNSTRSVQDELLNAQEKGKELTHTANEAWKRAAAECLGNGDLTMKVHAKTLETARSPAPWHMTMWPEGGPIKDGSGKITGMKVAAAGNIS